MSIDEQWVCGTSAIKIQANIPGGGEGKVPGAAACPEVDERENSCEMNWEAKRGDKKNKKLMFYGGW